MRAPFVLYVFIFKITDTISYNSHAYYCQLLKNSGYEYPEYNFLLGGRTVAELVKYPF